MIEIKDKQKCSGCSACAQKCPKHCIVMTEDGEGFLYPQVNHKKCIDCGLCEIVCPSQRDVKKIEPIKILAAYNKDEDIRIKSSSGGIFPILAERIINSGGVVFGARFNEKWEVLLDYSETIQGISAFQGSKYVQAVVGRSFEQCEQFLRQGRQVLFSGTPCQIAGLNQYLGKEYSNLLTIDVVCHGVPSPMVWQRYLKELIDVKNEARKVAYKKGTDKFFSQELHAIKDIKFRDKSDGWKQFSFVLTFDEALIDTNLITFSNSVNEKHSENIFMKAFLQDLILRPSCYECQYRGKTLRQADISIADFWGIQEVAPELDDDKGISLILLNTEKGNSFCPFDQLKYKYTDLIIAPKYNGGLRDSIEKNPRRDRFFRKIKRTKHILNVMAIHVLPECQYEQKVTPAYLKMLRKIKKRIRN